MVGFRASRQANRKRSRPIAVLDIGSTKIVCLIARLDEGQRPRVVGVGHQVSGGVRNGMLVDLEEAERAIRHTVHQAEEMADETISSVWINLSGGYPASQTMTVEVDINGHPVDETDIRRALSVYAKADIPDDSEIVHAIPTGFAIDDNRGIADPRGMVGQTLRVDLHVVSATTTVFRNLATAVNRAQLDVEGQMLAPYASALACLVEDERKLGATVIDLGGGTTGVAVFTEGVMIFADLLPVGVALATSDIARGLGTSLSDAERLKTLHGSAMPNVADERDTIEFTPMGEPEGTAVERAPKSLLTQIIQPRMEEIFELVRSRLEEAGVDRLAGRRIVLTGGGAQMQNVRELAHLVLDKQIRIGRPLGVAGLEEATCGPAFSTVLGLLEHAVRQRVDTPLTDVFEEEPPGGLWSRLGGWIRENI